MQDEFRLAGNIEEFLNQLESLKGHSKNLLIWQSSKQKKSKLKASFKSVETQTDRMIVSIVLEDIISFIQKDPIFIYDEKLGLLFKGQYEFCVNKNLKLAVDDKVYLKEKRKHTRHAFHYTKVEGHLNYQGINIGNLLIKDINELGAGVIASKTITDKLKVGLEVALTHIHVVELPRPITAKIVHITPYKKVRGLGKDAFLLGIKFTKKSKLIDKVVKAL